MIDLTLEQYDHQVLRATEPVLLYVSASWCGPCVGMKPLIAEFEREVVGVRIVQANADTSKDVLRHLGIRGIPAFVAFRDGVEIGRHLGVASKTRLAELLGM